MPQEHHLSCASHLGSDLRLRPPGRCHPCRIPGRRGEQLGACSRAGGGRVLPLGPRLEQSPASGYGSRMPVSLPWRGSDGGGEGCMQLALSFGILSPLLCEQARLRVRVFCGKVLSPFYFSSLEIPQFGLLSHISFLRLSSGLVLTLRTDDAAPASLSSPPLTSGGCEHLSCFSVGSCG